MCNSLSPTLAGDTVIVARYPLLVSVVEKGCDAVACDGFDAISNDVTTTTTTASNISTLVARRRRARSNGRAAAPTDAGPGDAGDAVDAVDNDSRPCVDARATPATARTMPTATNFQINNFP